MESSRPITSRPLMSTDRSSSLGERRDAGSGRRDGSSLRSTISRAALRGSTAQPRRGSRASQDSSKRGRKGYELSEDVDRGLVDIIHKTDVPFETVAHAVEEAGGPKKLWLRKRFEQITGTKAFGSIRLLNHRPSAEDRRQRTQLAMDGAERFGLHSNGHAQLQPDAQSGLHPPVARNNRIADRSSRRLSSLSTASTKRASAHGDPSPVQGRAAIQSWAAPGTKRTLSEDDKDSPTSYASNRTRARALSISSITKQLENLTGNTGFYDFLRRGSIKSHVSPLFRPSWWSRGSRATSGSASYPDNRTYSQASPVDKTQIIYVPDPTYQTHYHTPTPEDIASAELMGASAVSLLLHARMSLMSDEVTKNRLVTTCPAEAEETKSYFNQPDKNGVTALHLAVAYGFPQVSAMLMRSEANHRAVTSQGSSVCRFAKPAQELAGGDLPLYHRILHSRQWVCAGLPPRLPAEERISPTYERRRTSEAIPTLPTVEEASTPELNARPEQAPQGYAATNAGLQPPSLSVDFSFLGNNEMSTYQRNSAYQTSSYYFHVSPTSPQHCVHDHQQIPDLLTPNSIPRSAGTWSIDTSSPTSPFRFAPMVQPANLSHQGHGLFASNIPSTETGSFAGLNIMTGSIGQPMSTVTSTTPWLGVHSDFGAQTTHFNQTPGQIYGSGDTAFNGQMTDVTPLTSSQAPPEQFLSTGEYQPLQGQQHMRYSASNTQPLYPTPPEESGWPMNQHLLGQNWTSMHHHDVSNATARALAETFQATAWNPGSSQGTRRNDDYTYYQQDPTNQFH